MIWKNCSYYRIAALLKYQIVLPKCCSVLLGLGAKTAPKRKQAIWQTSRNPPIYASFLPLIFSIMAPAIFTDALTEKFTQLDKT